VSAAEEFFLAARPVWEAQAAHPFVRGIADGTLDPELFKRWVRQDYRYLIEFSRVLGLAAARADRLESMTWYADLLHLTLGTEMDLHRRYAARFGISEEELQAEPMWSTTRAYTDFLVRTAATGEAADLPAVLLPCEWGFLHLAEGMAAGGPPRDARYADWITQYASPEYREVVLWLKAELDHLADSATGAERERLLGLFLTSSRYELRFWDMCWRGESPA
jgi:thiaminase/transcriptional activator TenA